MKISIVVITAREDPGFIDLVRSLQENTEFELELVYVDLAKDSRDGLYEEAMMQTNIQFKHLKDVGEAVGPAPSSARNLGISQSTGDWIVCIDDLTTVGPDTLRIHDLAYSMYFDAVVGSYTLNGSASDRRLSDPNAANGPWAASHFYGMHMGFRKSAWEAVGGFDESFDGVYGWEDCDFGHRLFADGASIAWLPTAKVNCQKDERHESIQARAPMTHNAFVYGELKWRNDALILWNKSLGKIDVRR
jgi:glycosyltransferase involved in cell wall biosynthesis